MRDLDSLHWCKIMFKHLMLVPAELTDLLMEKTLCLVEQLVSGYCILYT